MSLKTPKCPNCGWTLAFKPMTGLGASFDLWEAYCWNHEDNCKTTIVKPSDIKEIND